MNNTYGIRYRTMPSYVAGFKTVSKKLKIN